MKQIVRLDISKYFFNPSNSTHRACRLTLCTSSARLDEIDIWANRRKSLDGDICAMKYQVTRIYTQEALGN